MFLRKQINKLLMAQKRKTVTLDQIKNRLHNIYLVTEREKEREMVVTPIFNANGGLGSFVFSLSGTPPKAYAFLTNNCSVMRFFDPVLNLKGIWYLWEGIIGINKGDCLCGSEIKKTSFLSACEYGHAHRGWNREMCWNYDMDFFEKQW